MSSYNTSTKSTLFFLSRKNDKKTTRFALQSVDCMQSCMKTLCGSQKGYDGPADAQLAVDLAALGMLSLLFQLFVVGELRRVRVWWRQTLKVKFVHLDGHSVTGKKRVQSALRVTTFESDSLEVQLLATNRWFHFLFPWLSKYLNFLLKFKRSKTKSWISMNREQIQHSDVSTKWTGECIKKGREWIKGQHVSEKPFSTEPYVNLITLFPFTWSSQSSTMLRWILNSLEWKTFVREREK